MRHHRELPAHVTEQILRFFQDYKVLEHKEVVVEKMLGPDDAMRVLEESFAMYEQRS